MRECGIYGHAPGNGYALTALQAACSAGNEELVDILLEHGADIHATPTHSARLGHLPLSS